MRTIAHASSASGPALAAPRRVVQAHASAFDARSRQPARRTIEDPRRLARALVLERLQLLGRVVDAQRAVGFGVPPGPLLLLRVAQDVPGDGELRSVHDASGGMSAQARGTHASQALRVSPGAGARAC
eukprot:9081313-Ditylum_brightwellii.AAC.1